MKSLFLVTLLVFSTAFATAAQLNNSSDRDVTWLFAVNASKGATNGEILTLKISPHVIYFSDRPHRLAGNISAADLVDLWNRKGPNSFAEDPPNAVITLFEHAGADSAVIKISDPKLLGKKLSFKVDVIEGELPEKFKHASLFIDGYCLNLDCTDTTDGLPPPGGDNNPPQRDDGSNPLTNPNP